GRPSRAARPRRPDAASPRASSHGAAPAGSRRAHSARATSARAPWASRACAASMWTSGQASGTGIGVSGAAHRRIGIALRGDAEAGAPGARVRGDLVVARGDQLGGERLPRRQQVAVEVAHGLALEVAVAEELLGAAILERVVGDDGDPAARL